MDITFRRRGGVQLRNRKRSQKPLPNRSDTEGAKKSKSKKSKSKPKSDEVNGDISEKPEKQKDSSKPKSQVSPEKKTNEAFV